MEQPRAEAEVVPRTQSVAPREVVVGYDESAQAVAALSWAAARAEASGLSLRIVYAANPPAPLPWTAGALLPSNTVLQHGAAKVARRAADRVTREHPDLVVKGEGAVGSPAAELVMCSDAASFVVVGRRGRNGPISSLGSVSFALSAHARCPVVVVQGEAPRDLGPEHPVVVGVDASRFSKRAVAFAASMAQDAGADLVVVAAWSSPEREPWMGDIWHDPARAADLVAAEFETAASCVRQAVAQVAEQHPGVTTIARTPEGPAVDALLAQCAEAGLLVVGSRGHGGFAGLSLGSVSRALLRQADLPVAVTRDGGL